MPTRPPNFAAPLLFILCLSANRNLSSSSLLLSSRSCVLSLSLIETQLVNQHHSLVYSLYYIFYWASGLTYRNFGLSALAAGSLPPNLQTHPHNTKKKYRLFHPTKLHNSKHICKP